MPQNTEMQNYVASLQVHEGDVFTVGPDKEFFIR